MQQHEYAIIGHDRAQIGRYIGMAAGALSAASVSALMFGLELAKTIGLDDLVPPVVAIPSTAIIFYAAGFWLFNRHAWRFPLMLKIMSVPDLNGTWDCKGETIGQDKNVTHEWSATVKIAQTWEKIAVQLTRIMHQRPEVPASAW
jgi:hypothetical protein